MAAARSRLWLIAAQRVHAAFTPNRPNRGQVREGSVDQVGEGGLDDRVAAVGDVGGRGWFETVGEEPVVSPDREQLSERARSRTRRTTSRAVIGCRVETNAVNSGISATSASLIHSPVSGSGAAPG